MKSLRKQRPIEEISSADDSNWFWSNHRGGGGAPLKNNTGEIVSNLRTVLHNNNHNHNSSLKPDHNIKSRRDEYDSYENVTSNNYHSKRQSKYPSRDHSPRSSSPTHHDDRISSSPRKFMSALQDMNSGMDTRERNARLQKAREYQDALAMQIAEKKRLKEEEKYQIEEEKRKELEKYLQEEYRGDIPSHVKEKLYSPPKHHRVKDSNNHRRQNVPEDGYQRMEKYDGGVGNNGYVNDKSGQSIYNLMRKPKQASYEDEVDRNYRNLPPRDRVKEKLAADIRRNRKENNDDDNDGNDDDKNSIASYSRHRNDEDDNSTDIVDYSDDEYGHHNNYNRQSKNQKKSKHRQDKISSSKSKPDDVEELTELCNQLMEQQKELQDEVKKQAEVIQELQSVSKRTSASSRSVAAPRTAGIPSNQTPASIQQQKNRSKSVQQPRIVKKSQQQQPTPKVAFGGAAKPTVVNRRDQINKIDMNKPVLEKKSSFHKQVPAPVQARAQIQAQGIVKGGPVIVSYEEEDSYNYPDQQPVRRVNKPSQDSSSHQSKVPKLGIGNEMRNNGRNHDRKDMMISESIELRGESEYLRIGGDEVDVISGDQLDRLLVQAKTIRGGNKR